MDNRRYDVIVIGGGHNGLVNAAYLARAGKRVLLLERRHTVGGATVTEEIYPGFKYLIASYLISLLRPERRGGVAPLRRPSSDIRRKVACSWFASPARGSSGHGD